MAMIVAILNGIMALVVLLTLFQYSRAIQYRKPASFYLMSLVRTATLGLNFWVHWNQPENFRSAYLISLLLVNSALVGFDVIVGVISAITKYPEPDRSLVIKGTILASLLLIAPHAVAVTSLWAAAGHSGVVVGGGG